MKGLPTLFHSQYGKSTPIFQALLDLGVAHNKVEVQTLSQTQLTDESFLKLNPNGETPVYVDERGDVLVDPVAIMLKVLDQFDVDHKLLAPTGSPQRYEALSIMCFCVSAMAPPREVLGNQVDDQTKTYFEEVANTKLRDNVKHLLKDTDSFLFGDTMTAADHFLSYHLYRYMYLPKPLIVDEPVIKQYLGRCDNVESCNETYGIV